MASSIDSHVSRAAGQSSLHSPIASQTPVSNSPNAPRSRDIFDAAHAIEAGEPSPTPPSVLQRLAQTLGVTKRKQRDQKMQTRKISLASIDRPSRHDHISRNPVHRQLPEEHTRAWQAAEEKRRATVERLEYPPQFDGPVPNSKKLRDPAQQKSLSRGIDEAFLTEMEEEFYSILRRVGRCAYYRPIITSGNVNRHREILLVHRSAVEPLQKIQSTGRSMTDAEKYAMMRSLDGLLISHLLYTLQRVLFRPDLEITSSSSISEQPQGGEQPPPIRTNKSEDFFNSSRWAVQPETGPDAAHTRLDVSPWKGLHISSFSQRQFAHGAHDTPSDPSPDIRLRLRGGGNDEDQKKKFRLLPTFGRAGTEYVKLAFGAQSAQLKDGERPPKALWWLAGGRTRHGKQVPTAGELRERRKNELENRKAVGFVGTILNHRIGALAGSKGRVESVEHVEGDESAAAGQSVYDPYQPEVPVEGQSTGSQPPDARSKAQSIASSQGKKSASIKPASVKANTVQSGSKNEPGSTQSSMEEIKQKAAGITSVIAKAAGTRSGSAKSAPVSVKQGGEQNTKPEPGSVKSGSAAGRTTVSGKSEAGGTAPKSVASDDASKVEKWIDGVAQVAQK